MPIVTFDISTHDDETTTCLEPSDTNHPVTYCHIPEEWVNKHAFYKVLFHYKLLSAGSIKIQASQKYVIYFLVYVYCI